MARRVRRFSALATGDVALGAGVETVVATIAGIVGEFADGHVVLLGNVAVTGAAGVTSMTLRVRRAALAGAIVGELAVAQVPAAVQAVGSIQVEEDFAGGAPPTYVLTAQSTGGASTATQSDLVALVS